MRKAITALLGALIVACSVQKHTAESPATSITSVDLPRRFDVTSLHVTREFATTMHAENWNDTGRKALTQASKRWWEATQGRVRIDVVFDLDFDSLSSLYELSTADKIIALKSDTDLAKHYDAILGQPGLTVLAVTQQKRTSEIDVYLMVERIADEDFEAIATHEFGHVFGLPDLPNTGSVMSGAGTRGVARPKELTWEDLALCRAERFCQ